MKIYPAGHAPSRSGPPDWFTGRVRLDPLFNPDAPEIPAPAPPGTRTPWARP